MRANQLRLWFSSMAYVLLCALRRIGLQQTRFAKASCGSIRLALLKIGAAGHDQRAAHQVRHGIGLSLPGRLPAGPRLAHRGRPLTNQTAHSPPCPTIATPFGRVDARPIAALTTISHPSPHSHVAALLPDL